MNISDWKIWGVLAAIIGVIADLAGIGVFSWTKYAWVKLTSPVPSDIVTAITLKARNLQLGSPHKETPLPQQTGPEKKDGYWQRFERGWVYYSHNTGLHFVGKETFYKWDEYDKEQGLLGFPTSDQMRTPDSRGRFTHFESGSIYWTTETKAHEVHSGIHATWKSWGWEQGPLGYPISDERKVPGKPGAKISCFQNGYIYWEPGIAPTVCISETATTGCILGEEKRPTACG